MFEDKKEKYREFREWQKVPHHVKPMSEEEHVCPTCGRRFEGNYCPQCGQSSKIGRYSFKNAFLLFIDVWGVGNRGMFRSIRDLLLRPGYMIRDYLRGMQMAYFPPFKMFFLLCALSLLIYSGLNIKGINQLESQEKEAEEMVQDVKDKLGVEQSETQENKTDGKTVDRLTAEKQEKRTKREKEYERLEKKVNEWTDNYESYLLLFLLLVYSWPLWLLIRHCPAIPDLRFSECLVAMVYIINMLSIYTLIPAFLCLSLKADMIFSLTTTLLIIIPIKQLSGYSYWQTIWRLLVALIPFVFILLLLAWAEIAVLYIYAAIKVG